MLTLFLYFLLSFLKNLSNCKKKGLPGDGNTVRKYTSWGTARVLIQLFFPKDLNQVLCNAEVVFLSGLIFFVVYFYDIF